MRPDRGRVRAAARRASIPFDAQAEDAPLVHEKLGTNVAYERTFTFGEVDKAFAEAPRKVQAKLRWPRSTGMPMDTNGAIGDYDPRHRRRDDLRQLDELHVLPLADRRRP